MFEANSHRHPTHYALTDEQAAQRYLRYKRVDPFLDIPSALLNSADISDYVAATGLIFPFEEDDDDLKSAALRVRMLGDIVYWGSDGEKKSCVLNEGEEFTLAANSITYITLEPYFRIPDYIKVWFNLDASHVYKGLLLNSSFIDPGFVGRLSLPLHNPTANEYVLRARDSLIWITLMKISPPPQSGQHDLFANVRQGKFREFPERKKRQTIDDYLEKAVGRHGNVRSAVPAISQTVHESFLVTEKFAKEAAESARAVKELWKTFLTFLVTAIAVLTLAIAVLTLFWTIKNSNNQLPETVQPSAPGQSGSPEDKTPGERESKPPSSKRTPRR